MDEKTLHKLSEFGVKNIVLRCAGYNQVDLKKASELGFRLCRGALIETKLVIDALKSRKVGNLGINVYEQEENLFFQNLLETIIMDEQIARLMTFPNVLITGHQAFLTHEALAQIVATTLQNLDELTASEDLINEVKWKSEE